MLPLNYSICLSHIASLRLIPIIRAVGFYQLADGDSDETNPLGGRISFSDSRMKSCCADEQGRVTYSLMPDMAPGRMIIFPSYLMHYIYPYTGDAPRISLSWNISTGKIAGSPLPEVEAQREKLAVEK